MPKFTLNDTLYRADCRSNVFSRAKLEMIDQQGRTWYRYDKPTYEYSVNPVTIVAIETHQLESIPGVTIDADLETMYHLSDNLQVYESEINCTSFQSYQIFDTLQLAEAYIQNHRERHDV